MGGGWGRGVGGGDLRVTHACPWYCSLKLSKPVQWQQVGCVATKNHKPQTCWDTNLQSRQNPSLHYFTGPVHSNCHMTPAASFSPFLSEKPLEFCQVSQSFTSVFIMIVNLTIFFFIILTDLKIVSTSGEYSTTLHLSCFMGTLNRL